jgi:LPXTG-site transpeptidase (sortase) family protein
MHRKKTGFVAALIPLAVVSCVSLVIVGGIVIWAAAREGANLGEVLSDMFDGQREARPVLAESRPQPTYTLRPTPMPLSSPTPTPVESGIEPTSPPSPESVPAEIELQATPIVSPSLPSAAVAAAIEPAIDSPIRPGSHLPERPATRLVIPAMELDAPVILSPIVNQTWKVDHLGQEFVGHLEGTASPGSPSNVVLAGHVTIAHNVYGPFAGLGELNPGDPIILYEGDRAYTYIVDYRQLVERTAVDVAYPTDTGRVTLITCSNWSDELGAYQQRLIVVAHLAGQGS